MSFLASFCLYCSGFKCRVYGQTSSRCTSVRRPARHAPRPKKDLPATLQSHSTRRMSRRCYNLQPLLLPVYFLHYFWLPFVRLSAPMPLAGACATRLSPRRLGTFRKSSAPGRRVGFGSSHGSRGSVVALLMGLSFCCSIIISVLPILPHGAVAGFCSFLRSRE